MTQDDRAVDPGDERGEMATVNPVRVTGTSLGHTDVNNECPSQALAARRIFESYKCAQEWKKIGVEADDGSQEEVRLKVFHSKGECDIRLPRAQGSVVAARARTSKEDRPCGSDRDGGVY